MKSFIFNKEFDKAMDRVGKKVANFNVGDKVIFDEEEHVIVQIFPQTQPSPSADVMIRDKDGFTEMVNHKELEVIEYAEN